jgi:hypothetical protein
MAKATAKSKKPWDPDHDGDDDSTAATDTDGDRKGLIKKFGAPPKSGPIKKVRDMVAAHSKVPDEKKSAYKGKCVAAARKAGAMKHIPSSWLKKGE